MEYIDSKDLIIVAARKGSVGIKGKNKLLFDDLLYMRTLMQHLELERILSFLRMILK